MRHTRRYQVSWRKLFALEVTMGLLGTSSAWAQARNRPRSAPSANEPAAPEAPRGPRMSTSMGTVTLDGARFSNVRASCGMFEVLAFLGAASPAVRSCHGGTVALTIAGGAVTEATSVSNDAAGQCLVTALRSVRFGSVTCAVQFSAGP